MWARVDPHPARAIADAGHGWGNRVKDRISRRTLTSKLTRHPDWNAVNTTAPMPPPTPGPGPSTPPARCSPRWPSIAPRPISTKHPTRRNPLPPKSGPGPAPPASPSPTAANSAPTSGTPGAASTTPDQRFFCRRVYKRSTCRNTISRSFTPR